MQVELNFKLQSKESYLACIINGKLQCIIVLIEYTQSCIPSVGSHLTFDLS